MNDDMLTFDIDARITAAGDLLDALRRERAALLSLPAAPDIDWWLPAVVFWRRSDRRSVLEPLRRLVAGGHALLVEMSEERAACAYGAREADLAVRAPDEVRAVTLARSLVREAGVNPDADPDRSPWRPLEAALFGGDGHRDASGRLPAYMSQADALSFLDGLLERKK
jgi:hypothetical protein